MTELQVGAIEVDVLLFGPLAEVASAAKVSVTLPEGSSVEALLAEVANRYPALRTRLGSVAVAVNLAYAARGSALRRGDEVALIPPVSGG